VSSRASLTPRSPPGPVDQVCGHALQHLRAVEQPGEDARKGEGQHTLPPRPVINLLGNQISVARYDGESASELTPSWRATDGEPGVDALLEGRAGKPVFLPRVRKRQGARRFRTADAVSPGLHPSAAFRSTARFLSLIFSGRELVFSRRFLSLTLIFSRHFLSFAAHLLPLYSSRRFSC
jgi:hypothetical protein